MAAQFEKPAFVPPKYSIIQKLGSGQTSHVYLARHSRREEVALKLPRDSLQQNPVLWRMFENEVQITLSLRDNHVVRAHEGFPTGSKAFLALEYCPGGTLDQLLLERGQLTIERAARLIMDVAQGLRHSHLSQVLHRDVKPANVFLDDKGRAKLGDFGTGIFMTEQTDERVGTAFYMAPEIFEGTKPSVQSDVYSLGVLAYEVFTGIRPFSGDSYEQLMLEHMTGLPTNPRHHRKDLSESMVRVLSKAMSRDAKKRYLNVNSFIKDFTDVLDMDITGSGEELLTGRASRRREVIEMPTKEKKTKGGLFSWFKKSET